MSVAMGTQDKGDELIQAQALRALGILYDSIRDDGDSETKAPAPPSGVFTGISNEDNQDTKDGDNNFPPLPSSLQFALSRPTPKPRKTKRHNSRRHPLTIPTPPLLQSCLMDDSEIMRLTTIQSPEPVEEERPRQSLPPRASFPTQFPVPLQVPVAKPADNKDTLTAPTTTTTTTKPTDPSPWTLIPPDPDWDLLDDDS